MTIEDARDLNTFLSWFLKQDAKVGRPPIDTSTATQSLCGLARRAQELSPGIFTATAVVRLWPSPSTNQSQRNKNLNAQRRRRGFTLIELLVVIVIIILVSAVALPALLHDLSHRQVSEAARLLQGALAGARDRALQTGAPAGFRLVTDPAFPAQYLASGALDTSAPLAFEGWIPIEPAPDYTTGAASIYPAQQGTYATTITGGLPAIVVEQSPGRWVQNAPGGPWHFQISESTSWFWSVRVGEKVQINGGGAWYTVCGPITQANPEGFVNVGAAGTTSPLARVNTSPDGSQTINTNPEYLLLVNGLDDNGNGWVDEGYDGVDNNLAAELANNTAQVVDEAAEWEQERWLGQAAPQLDQAYVIRRRPAPVSIATVASLPTNVVIDATAWASSRERSRLPVDPSSGAVEIMVSPTGQVVASTRYGVPSAFGMDSAFLHFWLAERSDVGTGLAPAGNWYLVTVTARTGRVSASENPDPSNPFAAAQQGAK